MLGWANNSIFNILETVELYSSKERKVSLRVAIFMCDGKSISQIWGVTYFAICHGVSLNLLFFTLFCSFLKYGNLQGEGNICVRVKNPNRLYNYWRSILLWLMWILLYIFKTLLFIALTKYVLKVWKPYKNSTKHGRKWKFGKNETFPLVIFIVQVTKTNCFKPNFSFLVS